MKDYKSEIKKIVLKHLPSEGYQAFLFGSRSDGTAKAWSDWDIGLLGPEPVPAKLLAEIEEELEDSEIPFLVEVVDLVETSPKFRAMALKKAELWTK
ncbi:MAG: nucleotidyltransferase domain-containing protein [Patescibacteria group bacterium]